MVTMDGWIQIGTYKSVIVDRNGVTITAPLLGEVTIRGIFFAVGPSLMADTVAVNAAGVRALEKIIDRCFEQCYLRPDDIVPLMLERFKAEEVQDALKRALDSVEEESE